MFRTPVSIDYLISRILDSWDYKYIVFRTPVRMDFLFGCAHASKIVREALYLSFQFFFYKCASYLQYWGLHRLLQNMYKIGAS